MICTGAGGEGDGERAPDVRVGRKSSRHGKPGADHFRADHGYGVLLCCFACAHALTNASGMLARSLALVYKCKRVSIHLGVPETAVIVAVLVHALQNLRDLIPMRLAISPPMRCRCVLVLVCVRGTHTHTHTLSLSLSLSLTHTHTHTRMHACMHACRQTLSHYRLCTVNELVHVDVILFTYD